MHNFVTYSAFISWRRILVLAVFGGIGLGSASAAVEDQFTPLPANSVRLSGYLEGYIQNSITHWNKGVVPYAGFVRMFRTGRSS